MREGYELTLLQRATASVVYPETPQLRSRVLAAIEAPAALRRPAFTFASIAAALALLVGAIALGVPSSRTAIAEFFGIEGSDVEILPTPPPGTSATPLPTPSDLPTSAIAVPLNDIDAMAGFDVAFADGEEPRRAYVVTYMGERIAIFQYYGFDLWQAHLDSGMVASKGVPPGVRVEEFELRDGVPARWITGGAHLLAFRKDDGTEIEESIRTVRRNTLIWRTDHAFYRIETELPLEEAREIAKTLP
jgi:hypothetical protein